MWGIDTIEADGNMTARLHFCNDAVLSGVTEKPVVNLRRCNANLRIKKLVKRIRVTVQEARGLHARPAGHLIRLLKAFRSEVRIRKDHMWIDARSILGLLMLGAVLNTQLDFEIEGEDEEATVQVVKAFFSADKDGAEDTQAEQTRR